MNGDGQCTHERADRHQDSDRTGRSAARGATAHLGLVGVRLGQPTLSHALPYLRLWPLFRIRRHGEFHGVRTDRTGGRRPRPKPLVSGADGVRHLHRASGADPRGIRRQYRATDAVDRALLDLLHGGGSLAVVHAAGRVFPCRGADRFRDRAHRGRVHDDLHQLDAPGTGRRKRHRAAVGHGFRVGLRGRGARAVRDADLLRRRREWADLCRDGTGTGPRPGHARGNPLRRAARGALVRRLHDPVLPVGAGATPAGHAPEFRRRPARPVADGARACPGASACSPISAPPCSIATR